MEDFLNFALEQTMVLLQQDGLIQPLLVAGAGTFLFLLAEQGARELNLFNALFVMLGILIGIALTALGLYAVYEIVMGAGAAVPPVADAPPPAPATPPAGN